ncbi:MAG: helix-turn-helix transcriptional regulator [Thermodesulfobacteriota bacterium]|nr:helix-turn-helix transcriptional regulator [Thermodesulfobacteriota bacterium]
MEARTRAGLTQQQVAERMGTTQSAVARMESGNGFSGMTSIKKYAKATDSKIYINLIPA